MAFLLLLTLATYAPCLISLAFGGSFWIKSLNFGFVEFAYGALPLFLSLLYIGSIPFAIFIRWDMKKRAQEQREMWRGLYR